VKIKIYIDFNNIKCYFNNVKGGEDVERIPDWIMQLEEEDLAFIKNFVLASGSLKEIAGIYGVTYPTVRLRLDKLIQKIQLTEQKEQEPYVRLIKELAMDDKLDFDTAKLLITAYRKEKGEK